uniref:Single-pass membrane and coiled-coil domain-containing protein 4 homolog n=1 Tax=Lepeophtheirus salmonis TaxID=72036 RepID=A0A0K2TKK6_LEPSM
MRQLKGKSKENTKEKKERRREFLENKEKAFTVALPALGAVFILIVVFIYIQTRPKSILD